MKPVEWFSLLIGLTCLRISHARESLERLDSILTVNQKNNSFQRLADTSEEASIQEAVSKIALAGYQGESAVKADKEEEEPAFKESQTISTILQPKLSRTAFPSNATDGNMKKGNENFEGDPEATTVEQGFPYDGLHGVAGENPGIHETTTKSESHSSGLIDRPAPHVCNDSRDVEGLNESSFEGTTSNSSRLLGTPDQTSNGSVRAESMETTIRIQNDSALKDTDGIHRQQPKTVVNTFKPIPNAFSGRKRTSNESTSRIKETLGFTDNKVGEPFNIEQNDSDSGAKNGFGSLSQNVTDVSPLEGVTLGLESLELNDTDITSSLNDTDSYIPEFSISEFISSSSNDVDMILSENDTLEFGNFASNGTGFFQPIIPDVNSTDSSTTRNPTPEFRSASLDGTVSTTPVNSTVPATNHFDLEETSSSEPTEMTSIRSDTGLQTTSPERELLQTSMTKIISGVPAYQCGKKIVGYYTAWGSRKFNDYHAQRLTHVIFAFMKMQSNGTVSDRLPKDELSRLQKLMNFTEFFPHLKVMFSVGGGGGSQYISAMASSSSARQHFIKSVLYIIDKWGFNGVDIDWEYPKKGGSQEGVPGDKKNYVRLMSELREALDSKGHGYLLSFAGAAGEWALRPGYDLPGLLRYADWVNVMTYDYYGAWEGKSGIYCGPPAPLFNGTPKQWSGKLNVDWTVRYYTCRVKDPSKIVMGVPFYGRYWKNVGQPFDGKDGMWRLAKVINGTVQGGEASYYKLKETFLRNSSFERHFHDVVKAPYLWSPSLKMYVGYEDDQSLKEKVEYAVSKNLGGLMIWAVDLDDDQHTLLEVVSKSPLCTSNNTVNYKCSPISGKRWWTWNKDKNKAGMCGKSAPLYKGYYPVCDPENSGSCCCGAFGYCGSGPEFCDCPTCVNYCTNPERILEEPVKPTGPILWYLSSDEDGKRGRCGRRVPKLNGEYAICNPDDPNAPCCSSGYYCGTGPDYCECDGCVDFRKNPGYRFKEKTWFDWSDGTNKTGLCGPNAPLLNGKTAECDPDSKTPCCSEWGYCGGSDEHCNCEKCVDYRKRD